MQGLKLLWRRLTLIALDRNSRLSSRAYRACRISPITRSRCLITCNSRRLLRIQAPLPVRMVSQFKRLLGILPFLKQLRIKTQRSLLRTYTGATQVQVRTRINLQKLLPQLRAAQLVSRLKQILRKQHLHKIRYLFPSFIIELLVAGQMKLACVTGWINLRKACQHLRWLLPLQRAQSSSQHLLSKVTCRKSRIRGSTQTRALLILNMWLLTRANRFHLRLGIRRAVVSIKQAAALLISTIRQLIKLQKVLRPLKAVGATTLQASAANAAIFLTANIRSWARTSRNGVQRPVILA